MTPASRRGRLRAEGLQLSGHRRTMVPAAASSRRQDRRGESEGKQHCRNDYRFRPPDRGSPMNTAPVVITNAATPAVPEDYEKLKKEFDGVATSNIGRWVASGIALAVPVVTAFCAWLQKEIGIDLDPASLTAFITSMAAGIAI